MAGTIILTLKTYYIRFHWLFIWLTLFSSGNLCAQTFVLYQLPANATYGWQQLNNEIRPLKTIKQVENVILSRIPDFKGECIVIVDPKGAPPYLWILNENKQATEFKAPIMDKPPGELKNLKDLGPAYFKDTLVVLDSVLVDITVAADFSNYNYNQFYFTTSLPKSKTKKIYRIPNNQYKKLDIKASIFPKDTREFIDVELYNELLPDKQYGKCYLFFPSPAFKADLLMKAKLLRDNAGFTLPDIVAVISIDLQRRGTIYYKPLYNWLARQLTNK
jgi:hypothetical protein